MDIHLTCAWLGASFSSFKDRIQRILLCVYCSFIYCSLPVCAKDNEIGWKPAAPKMRKWRGEEDFSLRLAAANGDDLSGRAKKNSGGAKNVVSIVERVKAPKVSMKTKTTEFRFIVDPKTGSARAQYLTKSINFEVFRDFDSFQGRIYQGGGYISIDEDSLVVGFGTRW